eukprot:CAMPEP_0204166744 /NCGR_PEP_ID=MMETSP0361-20130328/39262_1 /ASSEMBLY_ACC=CAM_ASM_000343 /TAXON_ID=268821 /ORGANISM="Scrippsiella Hangoei, Strain SHTV-5" /LENGTH=343 /DNA_ID=CAMNT_0051123941 /DNA_START=33 /DNA_END=1064 /DNA_ORIENTATION=-
MPSQRSGLQQQARASLLPLFSIPEFDDLQAIKPTAAASRSVRDDTTGISGIAGAQAAADEAAMRQLDRALFGSLPKYKATDFASASHSASSGHGDDGSNSQAGASHCAPATDKLGGLLDWLGRDVLPQLPATDNLDGILDWVGLEISPQHKEMDHHNVACRSARSAHHSAEYDADRDKAETWPVHFAPAVNGMGLQQEVRPPSAPRLQTSMDVSQIGEFKRVNGTVVDLSVARSRIQKHLTSGAPPAPARLDEASSVMEIMNKIELDGADELLADGLGQLQARARIKMDSETGHRAAEYTCTKLPSTASDRCQLQAPARNKMLSETASSRGVRTHRLVQHRPG